MRVAQHVQIRTGKKNRPFTIIIIISLKNKDYLEIEKLVKETKEKESTI